MNIYDVALIIIFTFWFLLSLLLQWQKKVITKIRSKDLLHLIPNWRFFAPTPARKDYHLEYRIKLKDSKVGIWKRIEFSKQRNYWCVLWYPDKRFRKAFNTSVRRITRMLYEHGYDSTAKSIAYLHLLNYLQNNNVVEIIEALQFRIISQQDFASDRKPRLVFTSNWHASAKKN